MPDLFGQVTEWESYIIQPAYDPALEVVKFPVSILDHAGAGGAHRHPDVEGA